MQELVSIILLGVSLSMDTFSLSLTIGSIINNSKVLKILPLLVGIFHFFMPLIGTILGIKVIELFNVASNILLGFILLVLGIHLLTQLRKENNLNLNLTFVGALSFAFSVSIDSFSVGLGMSNITNNYLLSFFIFSILSFSFTTLGLILGKYTSDILGRKANIIGIILLLVLGIYYLFV